MPKCEKAGRECFEFGELNSSGFELRHRGSPCRPVRLPTSRFTTAAATPAARLRSATASFIHTILESTCSRPAKVPKPQSTPAITFSRPTTLGVLHDAVGDQLRMLDEVRGRIDHARDDDLAVRQLDVLPDLPLVPVARVGARERHRLRAPLSTMSTMSAKRHVLVVGALRRGPSRCACACARAGCP